MREAQEEARQEMEESGKKSKNAFTDAAMKGSAKAVKRREAQREKELESRSLYDEDVRKERKQKQKKRKAASSDALGDGGLFSEEKVSYAKKAKNGDVEKPRKSAYTFTEYDPNKKKGKKKSHHGFKSRSKYKRK